MDSVAEKLEQSYSGSAEYYSLHWWIRIVYPWCIIAILEKESWIMDLFCLIGRQNVRFGHWQYKCSCHLMNVSLDLFILDILPGTLFFTLIWSPALVAVFIIPCVAEDHYSRLVLEIIKASSYWKRDVCNSLWIESVKNEFLFTDWPNRPLDTSGCIEI